MKSDIIGRNDFLLLHDHSDAHGFSTRKKDIDDYFWNLFQILGQKVKPRLHEQILFENKD